jgi:outer membrane biogenesis lipoprotein LolB
MKRLAFFLLLVPLALATACSHTKKKPKENPAYASEVEQTFKQRWVEKRAAELMALGLRPDLARQQALEEYSVRFRYTHAADK